MPVSLFRPGENCAAVALAPRAAFIVDAEDYFRHFARACERAERDILILGWDFDSRTILVPEGSGEPVRLGEFLDRLASSKRHLRIRILDWDYPMVFGTDRELPPTLGLAWKPHKRIDFRFDDTHPVAGSHHQKIVLVDGALAFSGGLDLTNKRWDTRKHLAEEPRRVHEGTPYPPFHDVMIAVDGEAARELGQVARSRWKKATGETLAEPHAGADPWPDGLEVDAAGAKVAVSLTAPRTDDSEGVRQVERLYLDMIAAAKRSIYIENQYFTSRVIGDALAARLAEPDGPEIVVVTRLLSHGWLEEITMTTLRVRLVRELRDADVHKRFHALYPHVPGLGEGTCLDIHSKVMVVDDQWLRIGSANLSSRSMGMDTECDVTLEAAGDAKLAAAVRRFRDCLIAEHMDSSTEDVARAIDQAGSIAAAVQVLGRGEKKLTRLEAPEPSEAELAVAKVGDPGEPLFEPVVELPETPVRQSGGTRMRLLLAVGALLFAALALALVWTHTPLKDYVTRENATRIGSAFTGLWWAPIAVVLAYTPASFIMFPRWIITMTAVLAFGAWEGFVLGFAGVILAGIATFAPGRLVHRETVRRLAGQRLKPLTRFMEQRGFVAVTLVRLVPIAPFPVVNLVMGAMRVRLWHFVLGTFLGMLPGMLAATVLSDQLAAALEDPSKVSWWLVAAAVAAVGALAWFGQRMVRHAR
ncbi:MAG TPA: VTT domain-containing protein [Usitatibacter sp.]|nr:VTT domain-containing protein [Usitatibacter sp.]